jgi:hypothetical protein
VPARLPVPPLALGIVAAFALTALVILIGFVTARSEPAGHVGATPKWNVPAQPIPPNGSTWPVYDGGAVPSLTAQTRRGDRHHLIKVEDWNSGREVVEMFVRDGETATVHVPPGTYRIKYASGSTWYEINETFGPDGAYFVAAQQFQFSHYQQGNQIVWTKETITLYAVPDGNLRTKPIPREKF